MNREAALSRSRLYSNIRSYFTQKGYLEVETPTLSADLIPEATIDNFGTTFINEFRTSRELYMIPSPEIFIKKLLAEGCGSVFEISKCFRNCEQLGAIHNPEFSMLEYYTVDFDETDSIALTCDMLRKTALDGCPESVLEDFEILTVREAVRRYVNGLDLDDLQNPRKGLKQSEKDLVCISVPHLVQVFITLFGKSLITLSTKPSQAIVPK